MTDTADFINADDRDNEQPVETRVVAQPNNGSIIANLAQLSMFASSVLQAANQSLAVQADNAVVIREFTTNRDGSENRTEISRHSADGVRTEARRTTGTRYGRPFVRETVTVTRIRRRREASQRRNDAVNANRN